MADEKTPQHIQYIVDALVGDQRGLNEVLDKFKDLSRTIKGSQENLKDLQKQINKGLGVRSPQEARQMGALLANFGQGDFDTRYRNQSGRRSRAEIDASPEMQVEKTTRALEKQHQARMRFVERELDAYERMAKIADRVRNTSNVARSATGAARRRLEEYIEPLLIDKNNAPTRGAVRTNQAQSIINRMAAGQLDPSPLISRGAGVQMLGLNKGEFREVLTSVREMRKEEAARQATLKAQTQEIEKQRRLMDSMRQQSATDKSIRRNFMKTEGDRMRAMPASDISSYADERIAGMRTRMSTAGLIGLQQDVADLQKKQIDRENRRTVAEQEADDNMRRRADRDNFNFEQRKKREAESPQRQAIMANQRADAFDGAGLFAIQGKLLANYATWGAGLGSMAFLGNYTVQYEKSLKQLQAISTATTGEMRDLDKAIIDVATNSIFSAQEVADAATLMAQAGLSVNQISVGLESVKNLALATGTDLATSMDAVTSTMTIFDLQTTQMADVANTLTAAMNLSKLTIDKFSLGLQYSGNIAETVGVRYNELAALLGGMTDAGIRSGSTLGTGLRQLMLDLQSPTDKAKEVFKRVGLSNDDLDIESQGIFRVLQNLKDASLSTADATEAFEVRAVAAFKALMNQLPEIEQLNQSILMTEAATDAAGVQMDSLAARWTQFTTGAGAAFYKTTEATREGLKGLLVVFSQLFQAIEPFSGILSMATLAAVTFMAVWSVAKVAGIIGGLGDMKRKMAEMTAATAGAAGAAGTLRGALTLLGGPITLITTAITGLIVAYQFLSGATTDMGEEADAAREATARAQGQYDETAQVLESLDAATKNLTARYGTLSKGGKDLETEMLTLSAAFSDHGLILKENAETIDTVIEKTAKLRAEIAATAALEAEIANQAAHDEMTTLVGQSLGNLNSGKLSDGTQAPVLDPQRLGRIAERDSGVLDFYRFIFGGMKKDGSGWFGADGLEQLDISEVMNLRGKLSKAQTSLNREKGSGEGRSAAEIDRDLEEILKAKKWADEIFLVASRVRNQQIVIDKTSDNAARARGMSPEFNFEWYQRYVDTTRGQMGEEITALLGREDLGADRVQEEIEKLREEWATNIKGVELATAGLFNRWVKEGVVNNLDEAKSLLGSMPVGDKVAWIQNALSRADKALDPAVNKLFEEMFNDKVDSNNARMRSMVESSRLQTMKLPGGSVPPGVTFSGNITGTADEPVWNRLPLPELVGKMTSTQSETEKLAREAFARKNPNAFATDKGGRFLNETLAEQYFAEAAARQFGFEKNLETVYRNYGKDFLTDDDKGRRNKDAETELLKQRIAAKRAQMDEIYSSVDGQSPAETVLAAAEQYSAAFGLLKEMELELEKRTWDASPWKDSSLATELRQANLDSLLLGLDRKEGKNLANLNNTRLDTEGRDASRAAKARRQSLETRLASELSSVEGLDSVGAAQAKISIANAMVDSIVDEFDTEFWSRPEYREKRDVPEAIAEFTAELMDIIVSRTQNVIAVASAMVDERMYSAGRRMREMQALQNSFGNRFSRGRISSTQESMLGRNMEAEQVRLDGMYVSALTNRRSMLEEERTRLTVGASFATPGSSTGVALQGQLRDVQTEILGVTRELEQATLDYAAALGVATDPKWTELFGEAVQIWAEGEGQLLSWAETLADGLPGIFSNGLSQISQTLGDIAAHSRDTGDAVEDMARSIFRSLLDMSIKILANKLIQMAFSAFGGSIGGGVDASQAAYPAQAGFNPDVAYMSGGGVVDGPIRNRDSVPAMLMPGEVVMRKSAVDMIGKDALLNMNRTGQMATQMNAMVVQQKREPDMVNFYVVAPEQKPSMGPRDVVIALTDDILRGGKSKQLIKAVAVGALG